MSSFPVYVNGHVLIDTIRPFLSACARCGLEVDIREAAFTEPCQKNIQSRNGSQGIPCGCESSDHRE